MRALLICPSDRPALAFLGQHAPLALIPMFGRSLLDLWLSELGSRGARNVLILASDAPEKIRAAVGRGERWGLHTQIIPEPRELTVPEARRKYRNSAGKAWLAEPLDVTLVDRLPGATEPWVDIRSWMRALQAQFSTSLARGVGMREFPPGVFTHSRARIAPGAHLIGPCWIGPHAAIGPRAQVGPGSLVEEGAYVDEGAAVIDSLIGPGTYVGALTEVRESLAWGRGLCKWTTGSCTEVTDDFLLCGGWRASSGQRTSLIGRLAALAVLAGLSPVVLVACLRRRPGQPLFVLHQAIRTPARDPDLAETCRYHQLEGVPGLWRRWPELWKIVLGEFAWVGNRPLTRAQASELQTDCERLWLAVRPGLFSLGDAEGCLEPLGDEGRAHASFYAVQHDWRADFRILRRVFARAMATAFR
jgi:hypothetical protein